MKLSWKGRGFACKANANKQRKTQGVIQTEKTTAGSNDAQQPEKQHRRVGGPGVSRVLEAMLSLASHQAEDRSP